MSASADIAAAPDRALQILARLAELDLAATERAHERYMAAEDGADAAEAGRTYQRMARSLRQTLAVEARLRRERERAAREAALAAAGRLARADLLRTDITGAARCVAKPPEGAALYEAIEREIEAEALLADFADADVEDLIERICARLPLEAEQKAAVTRVATCRANGIWPADLCDPPPSPNWKRPPSPWRETG